MGETVSTRIVDRIADREGVDPVELRPPLYEAIDPEALDALFDRATTDAGAAPLSLEFVYGGYRVSIDESGAVAVEELDAVETGSEAGEEPSPG